MAAMKVRKSKISVGDLLLLKTAESVTIAKKPYESYAAFYAGDTSELCVLTNTSSAKVSFIVLKNPHTSFGMTNINVLCDSGNVWIHAFAESFEEFIDAIFDVIKK